jgi:BirA family transcriptional regulator, biotin operon repressor / biotin---[acetyl-CoA-carboxylase] ligase
VLSLDALGQGDSFESVPVLPEQIRGALGLKWPNDLVVLTTDGLKKVGGILVESRSQGPLTRVVIGVGINVFGPVISSTAGLEAMSLWESMTNVPNPQAVVRALAQAIATQIQSRWSNFAATGFASCVESFNDRHALHLQAVSWAPLGVQTVEPTRVLGVCCGVSERGGLLVRSGHHQESFTTELNSVEARVQLALPMHKSPSKIS